MAWDGRTGREGANPFRKAMTPLSTGSAALNADPTATSPISGLAQSALESNQFDEAIKWYEKWLALDPKSADAKSGLDLAKQRQSNLKAATDTATDFFKKLDDGKYEEASSLADRYSASFVAGEVRGRTNGKSSSQIEDWIEFMKKYRGLLGTTVDRSVESVEYTQGGRSIGTIRQQSDNDENAVLGTPFRDLPNVMLKFNTKYENKRNVVEILSLGKTNDGKWRISGYVIRETEAPRDPLKG